MWMVVLRLPTSFSHWYPRTQVIDHLLLMQQLERSVLPTAWLTHKIASKYDPFQFVYMCQGYLMINMIIVLWENYWTHRNMSVLWLELGEQGDFICGGVKYISWWFLWP